MSLLSFNDLEKKYEIIKKINYNNEMYLVYQDNESVYIGKLELIGNTINILPIDDELLEVLKEKYLND